ncbi:unnamed protein product [Dracunculus medinensis]|uniref:NADH-ubiquinone oxidoreductase chain 1 n=1 Tax=Dracunculus medinensis TaxID=318479 RepID=A0A3P7Q914_DRAME|nr:unnamed protein product [Dracunculus medinensis]
MIFVKVRVCFNFLLNFLRNIYWFVLPFFYSFFTFEYSIVFMMCLVGVFVYCLLFSGIVSKSKYGMLGGLRSSSQSVSYEVVFSIFLVSLMFELNRAPFDFSEGESELVSGFNVEYSSVPFVLLFLREYGSLLFFRVLFSVLFFSFSILAIFLFFFLVIFVRRSFPRFRYDKMMGFFWFCLMPLVLFFLVFSVFYWL